MSLNSTVNFIKQYIIQLFSLYVIRYKFIFYRLITYKPSTIYTKDNLNRTLTCVLIGNHTRCYGKPMTNCWTVLDTLEPLT